MGPGSYTIGTNHLNRLGVSSSQYLGSRMPSSSHKTLVPGAAARITKGNVKLDPALDCPKLVTRWRAWSRRSEQRTPQ